jgi:hypothetical protein
MELLKIVAKKREPKECWNNTPAEFFDSPMRAVR